MPSAKRAGDDLEGGPKKRGAGAGRTGQACDRCKIRKIRCDARPGGCSPCIQNNSECKTTDRITGRANTRGHAETLESENTSLKMYMAELQQQLRDNGLEPKAPPAAPQSHMPVQSYWDQNEQEQGSWGDLNTSNGLMASSTRTEHRGSQGSMLPEFRSGCIGDNYLGVSTGNSWLTPIEGTSLALFGMKLDVAEFLPPESDPTAAPMSYQTFLKFALGKDRLKHIPSLPSYEECKLYAEWYFKSIQIFIPVLHRPEFMKLLSNIFQGQYQPTAAETVMVHMVIAIIQFQYYCRNGGDQMRSDSMNHYHYALSFIPDLITGHTLHDIQALVVICSWLRNQPKPGAAWMFTNAVFGLVVEVGLHRSASNWSGEAAERDSHTIEMRKRIFWSTLLLHVHISGKLGRPMPIRMEDLDIEIPEAHADNMPEERNLTKWRRCSFRAAIQGFKLLKILMQVYSTLYSIRSGTEPYDVSVQNIDKQLDNFREQLPAELAGGPATVEEDRCPALYLIFSEEMIRLVLHHPSLCRSMSSQTMADNLEACLEASRKLLLTCSQLKDLKSLDTTWMQTTDLLATIFTTLFVYSQRQHQMSSTDLQQLKQDMDAWLDVIGDAGHLLGAGFKVRDAVKGIIDYLLGTISRHIATKTASAAAGLTASIRDVDPATSSNEQTDEALNKGSFTSASRYTSGYSNGAASGAVRDDSEESLSAGHQKAEHRPYSTGDQVYQDSVHQPISHYAPEGLHMFHQPEYSAMDVKPGVQGETNGSNTTMTSNTQSHLHNPHLPQHQVPTSFIQAFDPSSQQNGYHFGAQSIDLQDSGGPAAWRNFTDSMLTSMSGHDFMHSAGALMALGNDRHQELSITGGPVATMGALQIPDDGQQTWPLVHYSSHPSNGQ